MMWGESDGGGDPGSRLGTACQGRGPLIRIEAERGPSTRFRSLGSTRSPLAPLASLGL